MDNKSLREIKLHGTLQYPFEIYKHKHNVLVTEHWHDETEIIFMRKGILNVRVNNKEYISKPGEVFFINSGELHGFCGENVEYFAFVFDMKALSFLDEDYIQQKFLSPIINGKIRFFHHIQADEQQLEAFFRMLALNSEKPMAYMLGTKAALLQIIGMLIDKGLYAEHDFEPNVESELLKRIISYINQRYSEHITLAEISAEFNMSPKYFCRFFKNSFNKTFTEYVNTVRVERAMKLLISKDMSITEAALECGFSNMSYFTRTFKRICGYTPRFYLKSKSL